MTQNRPPPAYQEYASSMMARTHYRLMSLAGRGLLYSMRLECWVNHTLPENPNELAKVLGFDPAEVKAALPAVLPFFAVHNGLIACPELDDYRKHLLGIKEKQQAGGKLGAKLKKEKGAGKPDADSLSAAKVELEVDHKVFSSVKSSSVKSSTTQPLKGSSSEVCDSYKDWMRGDTDPGFDPFNGRAQ